MSLPSMQASPITKEPGTPKHPSLPMTNYNPTPGKKPRVAQLNLKKNQKIHSLPSYNTLKSRSLQNT